MSNYVVWVFLGLAEVEEAKIYREAQWLRCFKLLDPLFRRFGKTATVMPHLLFQVPQAGRKSDPPGTRRITYKLDAPPQVIPALRDLFREPERFGA